MRSISTNDTTAPARRRPATATACRTATPPVLAELLDQRGGGVVALTKTGVDSRSRIASAAARAARIDENSPRVRPPAAVISSAISLSCSAEPVPSRPGGGRWAATYRIPALACWNGDPTSRPTPGRPSVLSSGSDQPPRGGHRVEDPPTSASPTSAPSSNVTNTGYATSLPPSAAPPAARDAANRRCLGSSQTTSVRSGIAGYERRLIREASARFSSAPRRFGACCRRLASLVLSIADRAGWPRRASGQICRQLVVEVIDATRRRIVDRRRSGWPRRLQPVERLPAYQSGDPRNATFPDWPTSVPRSLPSHPIRQLVRFIHHQHACSGSTADIGHASMASKA